MYFVFPWMTRKLLLGGQIIDPLLMASLNPDHHLDQKPDYESEVINILDTYSSFNYHPQHLKWTILASFYLTRRPQRPSSVSGPGPSSDGLNIISLATGTKCLPTCRFSPRGESVHDCHAEVLARRLAVRWFLEEIIRTRSPSSEEIYTSPWIRQGSEGKYVLLEDVQLNLYVSTLPCAFHVHRLQQL